LMSRFGACGPAPGRKPTPKELEEAFTTHLAAIHQIAREFILAGQVAPNNEVLLTTRVFRLKKVVFGIKLQQNRELLALALKTTEQLEQVIGPSAGVTEVEWDRGEY